MLLGDDEVDAFGRERDIALAHVVEAHRVVERAVRLAARGDAQREPAGVGGPGGGHDLPRGIRRDDDQRRRARDLRLWNVMVAMSGRFIQCSPLVFRSPASRLPCFCGPPAREQVVQVVVGPALGSPGVAEVPDHHADLRLHAVRARNARAGSG